MGSTIKALTTDLGETALKPMIRKWINDSRKEYPKIYTQYMQDRFITDMYDEDMEMGGFPGIPILDEGDVMNFATPDIGKKTRYQPDTRQLGFAISDKVRRFNKIDVVRRYSQALERSARSTMEQIAALPFNIGFASTYVGSDNKPLFATDHVAVNGATIANKPSSDVDLTQASLEAAIGRFLSAKTSDGTPINLQPRYLLVHPSNLLNARRVVGADMYYSVSGTTPSGAASGAPNVLRDYNLTVISNPYLTDEDAWFLLAAKDEHEVQVVRNENMHDRSFTDNYTLDVVYSVQFSMVSGWSTFIGVDGSSGG